MTIIRIETFMEAPKKVCFDLSRNVPIQRKAALETKERIIQGKTEGFLEIGDSIVWKTYHFGKEREMEIKVFQYVPPIKFAEIMTKGIFKEYIHEREFIDAKNGTIIIDTIEYEVPYSVFGKAVDVYHLENYIKRNIERRNELMKQIIKK